MDIEQFTSKAPGKILRIPRDERSGNEYAFIPDPLPPSWIFSDRLWPLLVDAKQQLGILEGIGRTLPNPGILLRPLEDREAIKSSRLEGTYVTEKEFLLFELEPLESKSEADPLNRQREVFNYRKAILQGTNSTLPISLRLLREFHETLLRGVQSEDRSPGNFRNVQVAIGSSHRFVPPPPEKLAECLDSFEKYIHAEKRFDPLIECFLVHYQFETIHPFKDGNGRVGRLLLAIMLKEFCGLSKPWLYLSEFFESNREDYVQNLFRVSSQAAWDGWIEFCLLGVVQQAKDTIRRCERLQKIQKIFLEKVADSGGSIRLNSILERIFHSPFVRIADLPEKLGVTYPTAKSDVERLVEAGVLQELEGVFPKTYYAPEIYNVAYEAME
ncbi:MAG: Fic family protein [Pirellulales bacterium]|nr:Fic family protein [Pirellulales bacterium]